MSDKIIVKNSSLSIFSILGIIFITLKLCNVIDWSWLWVLSPFWIPLGLIVVICTIVGGICFIGAIIAGIIGICSKK